MFFCFVNFAQNINKKHAEYDIKVIFICETVIKSVNQTKKV